MKSTQKYLYDKTFQYFLSNNVITHEKVEHVNDTIVEMALHRCSLTVKFPNNTYFVYILI